MPTSLRDLLTKLEFDSRRHAATKHDLDDSVRAVQELGRALTLLAHDGLGDEVDLRRRRIVDYLLQTGVMGAPHPINADAGPLALVGGVAADTVAVLRDELQSDHRWAIVVAINNTTRVLTQGGAAADDHDMAWTHATTRTLAIQALQDRPGDDARTILDRRLPQESPPGTQRPSRLALEALTVIAHRLRRASLGLDRRPTLLEIYAVTRAAESTALYAHAADLAVGDASRPDLPAAASLWREARADLQPFTAGAPRKKPDRDLAQYALRTHTELVRELGPPLQTRFRSDGALDIGAIQNVRDMALQLPTIAQNLGTVLGQMADEGELYALAHQLPFEEHRLDQFLAHRGVRADRFDLTPALNVLERARIETLALSSRRGEQPPADSSGRSQQHVPSLISRREELEPGFDVTPVERSRGIIERVPTRLGERFASQAAEYPAAEVETGPSFDSE